MSKVNTRYVNGNLVFYQAGNYQRWLDAQGPDVVKHLEHFNATPFASADNMAGWTTTLVEGGAGETTVALTAGATGGALLITTDAAENDGANLQVQGEAYQLAANKPLYFGVRLSVSEATQSDFLVGLAITDTDALGGLTDGIYFRKVDGSTTVSAVLEKDSTETTGTALTAAASTFYTLEFVWDGSNADFFVDGVAVARLAQTNLPDDEFLTPTIHFLTGAAAAITMSVDWLRVIQINS